MRSFLKIGFRPAEIFVCTLFVFSSLTFAGTYSGGSGTAEDPYTISTVDDWQELIGTSGDWDKHFVLTHDLDFVGQVISQVAPDMDRDSGFQGPAFTGSVDGKGHTISGFSRSSCWWDDEIGFICHEEYVGLFGKNLGTIRNLGLLNCYIGGDRYVGCLTAENGGTIRNCYSTGSASGGDIVGGLVGFNGGTIINCYSKVNVRGRYAVGGLVGVFIGGTICNCSSTGPVTGYADYYGGLVGDCNDYLNILNSFWDTQTSGEPHGGGGGVGKTTAEMKTLSTFVDAGWDFVYSDGNPPVWKMGPDGYPALFWEFRYSGGSGTAEDPFKISTVLDWQELIATSADWDKHFILMNDIDFGGMNLTPVAPDVDPTTYDFQGIPFTGKFNGNGHNLRNSIIDFPDKDFVGLFGYLNSGAEVWNLGADDIAVTGRSHVGGLCGDNRCKIVNCSSSSDIRGSDCFVGGLCGYNYGIISRCYSSGNVNGYYSTGGLCGHNYSGTISECYASGAVSGIALVGGLCGINEYSIQGCYAIGQVYGISEVGGLVGFFPGYGYSEGKVLDGSWYEERGGSVGAGNSPSFKESYWDVETSGLSTSFMGEGMTTAQMKTFSTFTEAGWDFVGESANGTNDIWRMCGDGIDYPRLSWEFSDSGDFDCPDGVALEDLLYLAERWLANTPATAGTADADGDGKVDLADFAIVASNWMWE